MIRSLLKKEWWQHGIPLSLLALATMALSIIPMRAVNANSTSGSVFEQLCFSLFTLFVFSVMGVAHRLISLEFREKSQLFLEVLPLNRWLMVTLKWLLGLTLSASMAATLVLLTTLLTGAATAGVDAQFLGILCARAAMWAVFLFSIFFLAGFLGRYRIAFFLLLYAIVMLIHQRFEDQFLNSPPIQLVIPSSFGYEREIFPTEALIHTGIISLALSAIGFFLGLANQGDISMRLGEKMSYNEKLLFGGIITACLFGSAILVSKNSKTPLIIPGATEETSGTARVSVIALRDSNSIYEQEKFIDWYLPKYDELVTWLAVETPPTVFVIERNDFEKSGNYEKETTHDEDSLLFFADYRAPDFQRESFLRETAQNLMDTISHERSIKEQKKWLRDGLAMSWQYREKDFTPPPPSGELKAALTEHGFTANDLRTWLSYEKKLGEDLASELAAHAFRPLFLMAGENGLKKICRTILGKRQSKDARAVLYDWWHNSESVIEDTIDASLEELVEKWKGELNL